VAVARSSPLAAPRAVIASPSEARPQAGPEIPSPAGGSNGPSDETASKAGFGFGASLRLHKTDEFSSVFAFRRVVRGRYFALHYCPGQVDTARLGVVVAKKLAKRAVQRNLLKRIGRDVFRHARASLPAYDLVLRLSAKVADVSKRSLREDMVALFERLPRQGTGK
jgi:ribonuclease P protein component